MTSLTEPTINYALDGACSALRYGMDGLLDELNQAYESANDEDTRAALRVLRRNATWAFEAVNQLINKLEARPALLSAVRTVLETSDDAEELREAIRALGAARVQDRRFDAPIHQLYQQLHAKLDEIAPDTEE